MIINLENLTKSKEAPKWHWLILDPMGAFGYTISFLPQNIDLLDLFILSKQTYLFNPTTSSRVTKSSPGQSSI